MRFESLESPTTLALYCCCTGGRLFKVDSSELFSCRSQGSVLPPFTPLSSLSASHVLLNGASSTLCGRTCKFVACMCFSFLIVVGIVGLPDSFVMQILRRNLFGPCRHIHISIRLMALCKQVPPRNARDEGQQVSAGSPDAAKRHRDLQEGKFLNQSAFSSYVERGTSDYSSGGIIA